MAFRQMKDPDANKIPAEFVNAWQEAVKTNSKAQNLFLFECLLLLARLSEYIHPTNVQAAKSALFEKWLQTGKDWSLYLARTNNSKVL